MFEAPESHMQVAPVRRALGVQIRARPQTLDCMGSLVVKACSLYEVLQPFLALSSSVLQFPIVMTPAQVPLRRLSEASSPHLPALSSYYSSALLALARRLLQVPSPH